MAGRIPQSFIDDLLDRADIVDVVGSRMDLRKSGKNHSACCPFHDEKTPSFTVSAEKQFYYCFGCGAGGNAIGFVMDFDRIDFPEAVERLARHLGLEVPREAARDDGMSQKRKTLQDILQKVDRYYRDQLRQHPQAKSAIEYLKNRGLSGEIARDFGMGYAPPGWDNLLLALGKDDTALALLKEGGMLVDREEENKLYDRFRHRIMFPIRDVRGRTIGFGGRVLDDSKPKYLNSPETPLFHKGRELYGLYEANQKLRDIPNLVVVEGYMDVVALAQHNIHNAVATLGTAATPEHLDKLFRYTAEVVFCFDGDNAGRKAARRALETTLPAMLDGQLALFLVERSAQGVSTRGYLTQDEARAADVKLDNAPATLITTQGLEALTYAVDVGIACTCAEGVGVMERFLAMTVEYMNQRKQFGVPIATFQALRHRVADMKMQLELARSMSYYATLKLGAPEAERRQALSRAKVQLGQAMRFVSQQGVQLHGGIGVTDEYAGSHYFKKLTQLEMTFGDTLHHLGEVSARMQDTAGVFA